MAHWEENTCVGPVLLEQVLHGSSEGDPAHAGFPLGGLLKNTFKILAPLAIITTGCVSLHGLPLLFAPDIFCSLNFPPPYS